LPPIVIRSAAHVSYYVIYFVVPNSISCFDRTVTLGQYMRAKFRMFSVFLFPIFIREPFFITKKNPVMGQNSINWGYIS